MRSKTLGTSKPKRGLAGLNSTIASRMEAKTGCEEVPVMTMTLKPAKRINLASDPPAKEVARPPVWGERKTAIVLAAPGKIEDKRPVVKTIGDSFWGS